MKAVICSLTALVPCFANAVRGKEEYKLIKEIPIGGEGGWDILTIDSDGADSTFARDESSRRRFAGPTIMPNSLKLLVYGPGESAKPWAKEKMTAFGCRMRS